MRSRFRRSTLAKILGATIHGATLATLGLGFVHTAIARAAETPSEPAAEGAKFSAADLDELVGPIALYPDELLGIVLPASTYPLQIVQAARLLEKQKADPDVKPDEQWDASIIGILNYPEVVNMMNEDLNWTWKLGEAVADQQSDVMDAVQRFRVKVHDAGNLGSNDKVKIIKETEADPQIIIIESASPDVIYVPTYQPAIVVVYSTVPYPYHYSAPYPYYYHPRAAFWTGMFVGAAIGYGVGWGHHHYDSSIYIDRNVDINIDRPNRPSERPGGRPGERPKDAKDWKADKGRGKQSGARPGRGASARPRAGSTPRPETGSARPGKASPTGSRRPERASRTGSQRASNRGLTSPSRSERASRSSSLGGYKNGGMSRSHSSRGASSRGRAGRSGGARRSGGGRRR